MRDAQGKRGRPACPAFRLHFGPMMPRHALPDPLPAEPLSLVAEWLAEAKARGETPNPNAMVLASCDASGRPSARVVLCKDIEPGPGIVRFVTNYLSRKGRARGSIGIHLPVPTDIRSPCHLCLLAVRRAHR